MIKGVTFDVWGTLLDLKGFYRLIAKELSRISGRDEGVVLRGIESSYSKARRFRRLSDVSAEELLKYSQGLVAKEVGVKVGDFLEAVNSAGRWVNSVVIEGAHEVVREVKELGLKAGVLGNVLFWPSRVTLSILRESGLLQYFDTYVFADEVGVQKPDRRIFHITCRKLGIEPEEGVHVGDGVSEDLGGALSAGMKAVLIRKDLKHTLALPGILYVVRDLRGSLAVIKELIRE